MPTRVGTGMGSAETGAEAAEKAVYQAQQELNGSDTEFAVVFSSSAYDYEDVITTVREETNGATLIGSSSAGEFTEQGAQFESVTVSLVASDDLRLHVGLGTGLSDDIENAVESAAEDLPEPETDYRMGINLHDGLTGRGEEIAMLGYQQYPMPYVGASAADDLALEKTVVFANDTVATDAVVLGMIESDKPFAQAVNHGHEPVAGGFEVTAAEGSVVKELDGQPAYDVWLDAVNETVDTDLDGLTADDEEFESLLTRFEFGIKTTDGDFKVRWPGLTPSADGPLHFATKIPEGTELHLMDSNKDDQITAAKTVSRSVLATGDSDFAAAGALAFDCVCQAAILGDDFNDAISSMSDELDVPLAGMQTYGEVALEEGDMRAYHNTTSSVVLLPE